MMGRPQPADGKLFYANITLDQRVRSDNPLRAIRAAIDFDFVRPLVRPLYGRRGNSSVDPALLLRLMFIMFYEQVPSERALMATLSERLDWLWFCGMDWDSDIPDHSVISKARRRWGTEVFVEFFARILDQCVDAGLVEGRLLHADSSLIAANADKGKLQTVLRLACQEFYDKLEQDDPAPTAAGEPVLGNAVSSTDPDARLFTKNGKTTLGYKSHRVVDDGVGVITATTTTPANVDDGSQLMELLEQHEESTGQEVKAVAADKAYGTAHNYQQLRDKDVHPAIPHQEQKGLPGKFARDQFRYDKAKDCYVCPAGQELHRAGGAPTRDHLHYRVPAKVCAACKLRNKCTGKTGRVFLRHVLQDAIDWADHLLPHSTRWWMMRRRRIRAEGSFADALRHGFKRARWRGLANMTVQNLMIATIQNVRKLLKYAGKGPGRAAVAQNLHQLCIRLHIWSQSSANALFNVPTST
jgi:IS5 family transposase